ncbi:CinA family protein [Trueperella sp. LYQ141]|uniref:CinA family protein n=1 Tax=Trueperella sp. LYQ141 TaxID=3391058 RepID=UPI0039838F25
MPAAEYLAQSSGGYVAEEISSQYRLAQECIAHLSSRHQTLAVAESLTGGALASAFVDVSGASLCFRGGVVAYTVEAKAQILGVDQGDLARTGPVDRQIACQMARGVARLFGADYALATTGVAGPGSADGHPAGTVWIGILTPDGVRARRLQLSGTRQDVRRSTVECALQEFHKELVK